MSLAVVTREELQGVGKAPLYEQAFIEAENAWMERARYKQILPVNITRALALAGRGWGKTEVGANWCRRQAGMYPGSIGHVIAPTFSDLRGTIFEGVSGLIKVIPEAMIINIDKSHFEIRFANGSLIRGFSSEAPNRLRGPQCHWLWGDELAAWTNMAEMLSNIDFSLRLPYRLPDGTRVPTRSVYTTTPRPLEVIREMADDKKTHQVRGSLYENKDNLDEKFIETVTKHEGTKLGDQEIHGIILNFDDSAIIKKSWLRMWPKDREDPQYEFIYTSFDTAFTDETYDEKTGEADYTACTVWGVFLFEGKMNNMMLAAWRERLGMPDLIARAKEEMRMEYGVVPPTDFKSYVGRQPTLLRQVRKPALMIIEDIGSGKSLRQMLEREKLPTHPYNPGRASKLERMHAIAHVAKGGTSKEARGRIWIPESSDSRAVQPDGTVGPSKFASWADDLLAEVCIFTGPGSTKHDDFVDSFSQAQRYFADHYIGTPIADKVPKKKPPPRAMPNPYGG